MTVTSWPAVAAEPILVTTKEAADDAGVPDWVIRKWASDGLLPPYGTRGKWTLYRLDDVLKLETKRRQKVSADRLGHLNYVSPNVARCTGNENTCPDPVLEGVPVSLCREHLLACVDFVYNSRTEYKATTRGLERQTIPEEELTQLGQVGNQDVVYFVRFGDRIKIGYSGNFKRRMSEVPYDEILLVLSGTIAHESALHELFKDHRVTGEWFHPHPDILSFVDEHLEESLHVT